MILMTLLLARQELLEIRWDTSMSKRKKGLGGIFVVEV